MALKEYFPRDVAHRTAEGYLEPSSEKAAIDFFEGLTDFAREAQRLRWLNHPNIPKVTRFIATHGTAYFAMPYLPGQTFAKELRESGQLPQSRFRTIFAQLLDALGYIHDAGLLHLDLKPANVYMSDSDKAYLLDFGSARRAMERRSPYLDDPVTPGYSPIEQYKTTSPHTHATDIYAMAATMFDAVTGGRPPSATARIKNDPYASILSKIQIQYDDEIKLGIDAGLALRSYDRPQSVAEWRVMLKF